MARIVLWNVEGSGDNVSEQLKEMFFGIRLGFETNPDGKYVSIYLYGEDPSGTDFPAPVRASIAIPVAECVGAGNTSVLRQVQDLVHATQTLPSNWT